MTFFIYVLIGRERLNTPVWTAIVGALVYLSSTLVIILLPQKLFHRGKTSREELGLKGLPTWADLALAPLGLIVYFIIALVLLQVFSLFPFFDASEVQETGFSVLGSGLDRVIAFFALVVAPAVAEELIFRGWLYGKLRAKIPGRTASLIVSVLITSLTFALIHRQWNVGVNVFAMSLVLCALREITGTIYSGILLHMLKNSIAFFLLFIANLGA
ncbi:CPBP family intramembrane metalloprotease [Candidatus Saccharibacteria bacterium]|nr:CPBP family intramembrane metalloprotease [Candidatus Saccharibacteria bacterium]